VKWKARREHIIVHQDLMTGWTGKYSDEREFICRGGTYSTSLKNVSYNGKTSAVAATKKPSTTSVPSPEYIKPTSYKVSDPSKSNFSYNDLVKVKKDFHEESFYRPAP